MSKKRAMNKQEKEYVNLAVKGGCIICGEPAVWHHLPEARGCNAHTCGYGLCPKHHTGTAYSGQSIHSSRLLFTLKHGTELELMQKTLLRVIAELSRQTVPF